MKIKNIKKPLKGYSLIELLIVVSFISSAFAVVYSWASSQYAKAEAKQAVLQLERLKDKIGESSTIVSANDPNLGLLTLTDIVNVNNIIENKMVTEQEIFNDKIMNSFKSGEIKTSAKVMNVMPSGQPALIVPAYTLIIENVPKKSCGYIFTNSEAKEYSEVKVGNLMVKNAGEEFSPTLAAAACNTGTGDVVNIEFTQSIIEGRTSFGDDATTYSGATGRFVDKFNPLNRASIAVNGTGATGCVGGSISSDNGNYCSCPPGTLLQGDVCEAIGNPGVCIPGQGWNMITKACEPLPNAPVQGQAKVEGIYSHGQYVPRNMVDNLPKTDYHGTLSCDGELQVAGTSSFTNVKDKINGTSVDDISVPNDRFRENNGTLCGVCLFGEVDAQGRCTAFKE